MFTALHRLGPVPDGDPGPQSASPPPVWSAGARVPLFLSAFAPRNTRIGMAPTGPGRRMSRVPAPPNNAPRTHGATWRLLASHAVFTFLHARPGLWPWPPGIRAPCGRREEFPMAGLPSSTTTSSSYEDVIVGARQFFGAGDWRATDQTARTAGLRGRPHITWCMLLLMTLGFLAFVVPGVGLHLIHISKTHWFTSIIVAATPIRGGTDLRRRRPWPSCSRAGLSDSPARSHGLQRDAPWTSTCRWPTASCWQRHAPGRQRCGRRTQTWPALLA